MIRRCNRTRRPGREEAVGIGVLWRVGRFVLAGLAASAAFGAAATAWAQQPIGNLGFGTGGDPAGAVAPARTADSVYLFYGTVIEDVFHIGASGPGLQWTQNASYNSGVWLPFASLGGRWYSSNGDYRFFSEGTGRVALYVHASSRCVFTPVPGGGYSAPADRSFSLEMITDAGQPWMKVTNRNNGRVFFFESSSGPHSGMMMEQTSQELQAANKKGLAYTYHDDTRINQITTAQGQDYNIVFSYCAKDSTRLSKIEIRQPDATVVCKVEYTYCTPGIHCSDLGKDGDVIQVKISERAANDQWMRVFEPAGNDQWSVRCYQYRYDYITGNLKSVFEPAAIERIIAERSDIDSPEDVLARWDDDDNTGSGSQAQAELPIRDYATRWYTYYLVDLKTDNSGEGTVLSPKCVTVWAPEGEDLEATYGGTNLVEVDPRNMKFLVRSEMIARLDHVTREYFFLDVDHGPNPSDNDVTRLVIQDQIDPEGKGIERLIYGLNSAARSLRQVRITDPLGSPTFRCESTVFFEDKGILRHHLREHRTPEAHNVNSMADVKKFLHPTGNGGLNDAETLHDDSGVIHVYQYDNQGRRTTDTIKQGRNGTPGQAPPPAVEPILESL